MLMKKIDETLNWLERNQTAEKDEYDSKQKEIEQVANPIMTKAYQANTAPQGGNGADRNATNNPGAGAGPKVEEVD